MGLTPLMARTAGQLFFEQLEAINGVFWVGAGIGVDAPTCLPLGDELSNAVLAAICHADRKLEHAIFHGAEAPISLLRPCWIAQASRRPCTEAAKSTWKGSLRLELVLQCLKEELGADYVGALQFLKAATPNHYHRFLAGKVRSGSIVVTTNFDRMIEVACYEAGVHCVPYVAGSSRPQPSSPNLLKLHGDIFEEDSLGATLSSFQRGLQPRTRDVLRRCLADRPVIFISYSARDHFDISPFLLDFGLPKVIWLQHERRDDGILGGPVSPASHALLEGLPAVAVKLLRGAAEAWVWRGPIGLGFAVTSASITSHGEWCSQINDWASTLTPSKSANVVSRLAQSVGAAKISQECLELANNKDASNFDLIRRRDYLLSVGGRYRTKLEIDLNGRREMLSETPSALQRLRAAYCDRLTSESWAFDDRVALAAWFLFRCHLGSLLARTFFPMDEEAKEIAQTIRAQLFNDIFFIARVPISRHRFAWQGRVAERIVRALARRLVKRSDPALSLADQARTGHFLNRAPKSELMTVKQAYLELENLVGFTNSCREEAVTLMTRARSDLAGYEGREARKLLIRSARVSCVIGDRPGVAKAFHHLAYLAHRRGEARRARCCGQRALTYLDEIEAPRWAGIRKAQVSRWMN